MMRMRARHYLPETWLLGVVIGIGVVLLALDVPFADSGPALAIAAITLVATGLLIYRLGAGRDRLLVELSHRALTDGLTGVLNRGALEERAILELARARRDRSPVSLVVLDIDGFKAFNDTRGHPAGDELLRAVADGLRRETRQIDALARLGGDEFAVLLPGAAAEDAMLVAHRLRTIGATRAVPRSTLSIGVATCDGGGMDFEALWRAADRSMYEAKRTGGDAVQPATPRAATASANGASAPAG